MKAWKHRGLAILLAGVLCLGGSTGLTTLAYADEAEEIGISSETEDLTVLEESVYPEEWDADDPMNARAYEQMQNVPDEESSEADTSLEEGSQAPCLDAGYLTTKYGSQTFTHRELNAKGTTLMLGIDVSYYNNYSGGVGSDIDWNKVKASGVQFVIIRLGYRSASGNSMYEDKWFARNYKGAKAAGLKVGGYFFSQAITTAEAEAEADYAMSIAKKYNCQFDMPLAFDMEDMYFASGTAGRFTAARLSKSQKTAICRSFCNRVKAGGYKPMIYSNTSDFASQLDTASLRTQYPIWLARFNHTDYDSVADAKKSVYSGQVDYWQCSSTASVSGVPSANTDLDYYYCPNSQVYVKLDADGVRRYYNASGNFDSTYSGVAKGSDGWWYVVNGVVDTTYTGLAKNSNGWWRIESGKVNFSYTGFTKNSYGWWYVKGGKVQFSTTGVLKGTVDGTTAWWYVNNGLVDQTANTVAKNSNGWWYIEDGKVDFTYTGLAKNSNGWWRIESGKVNFNYNGFTKNSYGWWYLQSGKVQFSATGVLKGTVDGTTAWWYVHSGLVDQTANTVAKNSNGWWIIRDGKVDFTYTGLAQNSNGWWYIKDGKVDFSYTGTVTVDSSTDQVTSESADTVSYVVTKGKVNK